MPNRATICAMVPNSPASATVPPVAGDGGVGADGEGRDGSMPCIQTHVRPGGTGRPEHAVG